MVDGGASLGLVLGVGLDGFTNYVINNVILVPSICWILHGDALRLRLCVLSVVIFAELVATRLRIKALRPSIHLMDDMATVVERACGVSSPRNIIFDKLFVDCWRRVVILPTLSTAAMLHPHHTKLLLHLSSQFRLSRWASIVFFNALKLWACLCTERLSSGEYE
jgi:hypothetical protein